MNRHRFLASLERMEPRQLLTTYVVTTTQDIPLPSPPPTTVPVTLSLREAIELSNLSATPGTNNIDFQIPSSDPNFSPEFQTWTIGLNTALPTITHQVTIDGFTQGVNASYFYPQQTLPTPTPITSAPSTIAALDGNDATPRVVLEGNDQVAGAGFDIKASDVNLRGMIIDGFGAGVSVEAGAVGDVIQGNDIGKYLVLPVDSQTGIALTGAQAQGILGVGNSGPGVELASTNATVGGVETQDANVIIGNGTQGVSVMPGGHGNQILGNQIGVVGPTTSTGLYFAPGNGSDGVLIQDSSNYVGGQVSGAGNLISANGTGANGGNGVHIEGAAATRNDVEGNYIGNGPGGGFILGSFDPGNQGDGVRIDGAASNQIGGSTTAAQNVISSNGGAGVSIQDTTGGTSAVHNAIQGNIIGLTADGISVLGNALQGVAIYSADNTVNETNIISANLEGVLLSGTGASGNLINGNLIGTNKTGTGKLGNTKSGVDINGASNNTISGNAKGSQVISGNNDGVTIDGIANNGSRGNLIVGNFIGTDITGTIDLGNAVDGVDVFYATSNTIGGSTAAASNLISANYTGIEIAGSKLNTVQGNKIGTDITGTLPLGNEVDGVLIDQGSTLNTIGGSVAAAGNTIAFNSRDGVRIEDDTFYNPVLSNSIFANDGLGINYMPFFGQPINPATVVNPPTLTSVATSITSTIIDGTLSGTPNSVYTVQFFGSATQDSTGANEGGHYLGQITAVTGPNGLATFSANLPSLLQNGQYVTATATNSAGTTSNFSAPVTQIFGTVQFQMTDYTVNEGVGTATIEVTRTGGSGGYFTINYATADGTAVAGTNYQSASGTLTFNPGVNSQTFSVTIDDNGLPAADSTLSLNLSDPVGPIVLGTNSSAALNILGNVPGAIQFLTSGETVAEAAGTATFTVTRQTAGTIASVNYTTGGGTAIPGVDYTPTSGTLTFSQTSLSESFTVPILVNPQIQGNVSVYLTLSSPTNGSTIGNPSYAVLTIQPAIYTFAAPSYAIDQAGGSAIVTVTRNSSVGTTSVNYSTSNGTAVGGVDYVPTSGTLTFSPGQTAASFAVPILINPLIQGNETINLSLSSPAGGAILGSPSTIPLIIIDDGVDRHGPHVTSVNAISGPAGVAEVMVTFDEALNPATAINLLNYGYSVRTAGRDGKLGTKDDHLIGFRSASYNPTTFTVTLPLASAVKNGMPLELMLNAATNVPSAGVGISDLLGNLLDGNNDGLPGGVFTAKFVAEPAPKPVHSTPSTKTSHPKVKAANHPVKISSVSSHPTGPAKSHAATPARHR